ncbi:hypothetical protein FRC0337_00949 [Corynebacterium diphtheriae]|nr:hypothetical protein FRC0337_00949 [Corynebacterium diphtheriae]
MTLNFNARPSDNTPAQLRDRAKPEGWPVGSFESYAQAQAAVDMLADNNFPVDKLTIVGVDLMEVERVVGKLTWGEGAHWRSCFRRLDGPFCRRCDGHGVRNLGSSAYDGYSAWRRVWYGACRRAIRFHERETRLRF